MLGRHEQAAVDGSVLGLEQCLVGVAREVVRNEARTSDVGGVGDEKLAVGVEELRANGEALGQLQRAWLARRHVVDDGRHGGLVVADGREHRAVLREAQRVLLDALRREPAQLARLDVQDAGAVIAGGIARDRDALAVGVPAAEGVLRSLAHAEHLACCAPVGIDDVAITVLKVGHVLIGDVGDLCPVIRPARRKSGERVARQRRVRRPVALDLPKIQLARLVRRLGKTFVGVDEQPLIHARFAR